MTKYIRIFYGACRNGETETVAQLHQSWPDIYDEKIINHSTFICLVHRKYNTFSYLYNLNTCSHTTDSYIMTTAAKNGNRCVIEYLHRNRDMINNLYYISFINACKYNQQDTAYCILRLKPDIFTPTILLANASRYGCLRLVKTFAKKNPNNFTNHIEHIFNTACANGKINIALWIKKKYNVDKFENPIAVACRHGQFKILKWLSEFTNIADTFGVRIHYNICRTKNTTNLLQIVQWLISISPIYQTTTSLQKLLSSACSNGHTDLVKYIWTLDKKLVCTESMIRVSCGKKLSLAQFLFSCNSNISEYAKNRCFLVACRYRLDIAKWIYASYTIDSNQLYLTFVESCIRNLHAAQWLYDLIDKTAVYVDELFVGAAYGSQLTTIKWLTTLYPDYDIETNANDLFRTSCRNTFSDLVVTAWLKQTYPIINSDSEFIQIMTKKCPMTDVFIDNFLQIYSYMDIATILNSALKHKRYKLSRYILRNYDIAIDVIDDDVEQVYNEIYQNVHGSTLKTKSAAK